MKKLEGDQQLKSMVKIGLSKKAPVGMVDRIMANIAVSPVRRKLTVKAVEPRGYMASTMVALMAGLVLLAFYIKPETNLLFSVEHYINLDINPIWVAPVVISTIFIWAYIFISYRQQPSKM